MGVRREQEHENEVAAAAITAAFAKVGESIDQLQQGYIHSGQVLHDALEERLQKANDAAAGLKTTLNKP